MIVECKQTGVCHEAIAQSDDENTGKRYYFVEGEWHDAGLFTHVQVTGPTPTHAGIV